MFVTADRKSCHISHGHFFPMTLLSDLGGGVLFGWVATCCVKPSRDPQKFNPATRVENQSMHAELNAC